MPPTSDLRQSGVTTDRFQWRASYRDGALLRQINPDGSKNQYDDIPKKGLAAFQLFAGEQAIFTLMFDEGQSLIWRRRVRMNDEGVVLECFHIVGKRGGQEYIACVFEDDGRVLVTDKFDEQSAYLDPPQLHNDEKG